MAAPNIVSVSDIRGKSSFANVTSSYSNLVVNATSSNKVVKINTIYVTNVDGSNTTNISIQVARSGYSYGLANTMLVPADSTLTVTTKDTSFYLEEGDYIEVKAETNNRTHVICSYEEIS